MRACFYRDICLAFSRSGSILTNLLFFAAIVTATPFALGPDSKLLTIVGPGILWTSALLATLLGLDQLFQTDKEDGSLDLIIIAHSQKSLALIILAKGAAHWVSAVLPLIVIAPVLDLMLNFSLATIFTLTITLIFGTPALTFIGAVGAALASTTTRPNMLASIIVLPLTMPVIIFGVAASNAPLGLSPAFLTPFLLLVALTLFFTVVGPIAAAAALRYLSD